MRKKVVLSLCVLYVLALIYFLFVRDRGGVLSNISLRDYIVSTSNIIPFKTIRMYIMAIFDNSMNIDIPIKNLLVNLCMFMPYAFFVFYYKKVNCRLFFCITVLMLFCIEILQMFLRVGVFDIDDVILNAGGSMIVYYSISKIKGFDDYK